MSSETQHLYNALQYNKDTNMNNKTYEIYHVERNNDTYEEFLKDVITAKDLDEAVEKAKGFIPQEFLKYTFEDSNDSQESFIEYLTEFFDENGNATEQDEENDDQGYLQHCIRVIEIEGSEQ